MKNGEILDSSGRLYGSFRKLESRERVSTDGDGALKQRQQVGRKENPAEAGDGLTVR
jgi:hypothetical protein